MRADWARVPFRELVEYYIGGGWGKEAPDDQHVDAAAVIRGTDMPLAEVGVASSIPRRFHKSSNLRSRRLQPNDIVFEVSGGSKDQPVGRTLLVTERLLANLASDAMCASFCKLMRLDRQRVVPRFVLDYLRLIYSNRMIMEFQTQSTGISNFAFESFLDNHEILLPPMPVQKKIAAVLSAHDELIENNVRRIEILEEVARAVYREWFVNFRFPGHDDVPLVDSELGPIPEGWAATRLDRAAEVNPESLRPRSAPPVINYIDISSVSPGSIDSILRVAFDEAPSRARRIVRDGDTIWSTVRPNRRSFAVVLDPDPDTIASTGFAVLRPLTVPWPYVYLATTTPEFSAYLVNHARGSAYPAVNAEDFSEAHLLLPTPEVVGSFGELVEPMLRMGELLHRQNMNLRAARDLLLPKLVLGEVDVSGLDIDAGWLAS